MRKAMILVIAILVFATTALADINVGWGYADWQNRKEMTISSGQVPEDISSFPLLVSINDLDLASDAQPDGDDIFFTASDGFTKLPHEVETYESGELVAWVQTDLLSAQDTSIYMYYNNPDAENQESPAQVWDENYLAVYHLNEINGDTTDSTSNSFDGTPENYVDQNAEGIINGAYVFDGMNDRVTLPQVFNDETEFTIEAWVNPADDHGYIFSQRDSYRVGAFIQYFGPDDQLQMYVNSAHTSDTVPPYEWHHMVGTFDGSIAQQYYDGVPGSAESTDITWPDIPAMIGDRYSLGRAFEGTIDELRLSDIARSPAYIEATYQNQYQPDAFYTVGAEETPTDTLPEISNEFPEDGATGVDLSPTLSADIYDAQGDAVNWTIELMSDGSWTVLGSGTDADGQLTAEAPSSGVTEESTLYHWKVTADDGGYVEQVYSFTTRGPTSPPGISGEEPADGETDSPLDPTLSATISEPDGDTVEWMIEQWDGASWTLLDSGSDSSTFTASATADAKAYDTQYTWRVTADDGEYTTQEEYSFTTMASGSIEEKFRASFPNPSYQQIFPVMGDVDSDGDNEIVFAATDTIYVYDGNDGTLEWTSPDADGKAVELADLDDDGTPEIIHGTSDLRLRALDGDGTIRWTSERVDGVAQALFPIVTADIDGDSLPELYYASSDAWPDPYSGDISQYNGAITMFDHEGNILRSTWVMKPCWSGMSLGDTDFDGEFELYLGDRREGYHGLPANGLQKFNAHTLEPLWERPDIQHSSPIPHIADVLGDSRQEIIGEKITMAGPMIIDPETGEDIIDYSGEGLPTHGTATVVDIDEDGNLEMLFATGYPSSAPENMVVFDLVDGMIDFEDSYPYHLTWPPSAGDVLGDSSMEILAAAGNQGGAGDYPIMIYDKDYNLVEQIEVTGAGQLMPARVYDTDSDGLNELVMVGVLGELVVYDTPAAVPNPAPRTGVQFYSESRLGVAEYVPPPGPTAPAISDEQPSDRTTDLSLDPVLSVYVEDFQGDLLDVTIEIDRGAGFVEVGSFTGQPAGTFTAQSGAEENSMEYTWRVTATDEEGYTRQETYTFTTVDTDPWGMPGWSYRKQLQIDSEDVPGDLTDFPVLIDMDDAELAQYANDDGSDIIFTLEDSTTVIPHELEYYDSGDLVAWVNVPSVDSQQNTILYMYYGNPGATSSEAPQDVWDSGFLAVHHLNELSGDAIDSTSNGNDGTLLNGVQQGQAGLVDGSYSFDGTDDRIMLPQVFTDQAAFTLEGWLYADDKHGYAISQRDSSSNGAFIQYFDGDDEYQMYVGGTKVAVHADPGQWHYIVGTFDGTTATLYVDASMASSALASAPAWPDENTYIADRSYLGRAYQGTLDELRLSAVARDEPYIVASYNNEADPEGFMTVGSQETTATAPIITDEAPADGAVDVEVTLAELTIQIHDNQGDLMDYNVTTSPDIGSDSADGVTDSTVTVPVSGLEQGTEYSWTVELTDGTQKVTRTYSFTTTEENALLRDTGLEESSDSVDLRADSAGQDWYESRNDVPSLLTLDETDVAGNTGKKAAFSASATGNAYLTQEFNETQDGVWTLEWDIYIDSILNVAPYRAGMMLIGDDSYPGNGPNADPSERFVIMGFYKAAGGETGTMDLVARDNDDGWTDFTTVSSGLNLDQWYNIKVTLDLESDTYQVYLDDVYQMTLDSRNPKSAVSHISFAQWNDGAGAFYVDNIKEDTCTPQTFYEDSDGDGYGNPAATVSECTAPVGYVANPDDCDDTDPAVNPGETEVCNGIDDNCDGTVDEGDVCVSDLLVDSDFTASADSENLRNDSNGQDWYESRNDVPSLLTLDETDVAGNTGKKAKLTGSPTGNAYLTQEFSAPITATSSVEWDIYVDEIINISGNPDKTGWVLIGDDQDGIRGPGSTNDDRFVYMAFHRDGGTTNGTMDLVVRERDDTWTSMSVIAAGLNLDQWYNIRVELDVDAGTYDVYVDDAYQATATSWIDKDELTHISFATWNDGAGTFYVDDVQEST